MSMFLRKIRAVTVEKSRELKDQTLCISAREKWLRSIKGYDEQEKLLANYDN
jgi:hypothetical protein